MDHQWDEALYSDEQPSRPNAANNTEEPNLNIRFSRCARTQRPTRCTCSLTDAALRQRKQRFIRDVESNGQEAKKPDPLAAEKRF